VCVFEKQIGRLQIVDSTHPDLVGAVHSCTASGATARTRQRVRAT
jgi:hypothetical protein